MDTARDRLVTQKVKINIQIVLVCSPLVWKALFVYGFQSNRLPLILVARHQLFRIQVQIEDLFFDADLLDSRPP
jgi:hypothetical protein